MTGTPVNTADIIAKGSAKLSTLRAQANEAAKQIAAAQVTIDTANASANAYDELIRVLPDMPVITHEMVAILHSLLTE